MADEINQQSADTESIGRMAFARLAIASFPLSVLRSYALRCSVESAMLFRIESERTRGSASTRIDLIKLEDSAAPVIKSKGLVFGWIRRDGSTRVSRTYIVVPKTQDGKGLSDVDTRERIKDWDSVFDATTKSIVVGVDWSKDAET